MSPRAERRRRFSLTRQGKGYVFVTIGVGVASVNTGNNLLYLILGLLLSLLLVSGTLSDLALYQLRAKRRVPLRLYVGRPHDVEVTVENAKRVLPSYSLEVREEQLPSSVGRAVGPPAFLGRGAYVVRVPARASVTLTTTLIPQRRGLHSLGQLLITTRYPFGLIEKVSRRGHAEEVLVYPEVRDVPLPTFPPHHLGLAEVTTRLGQGTDTLGLRAHRLEDEARDIHFRRSASLGRLVSRERAAEADRSLTLALDERRPADPSERAAWDAAFEVAVSECASLAVTSLGRGISVAVETEGSESPRVEAGGAPDPVLRYLALLKPSDPDVRPVAVASRHSLRRQAGFVLRIPVEPPEAQEPAAAPLANSVPSHGGRAA